MDTRALDKLNAYKPLRDEVFLSLRNAILAGRIEPGERLIEKNLAQTLATSRTPVREALRKLELEGLVTYKPHRGVVVVGVSPEDAAEIYTIRAVLEGLAARLAASRRTPEEVEELHRLLEAMQHCITRNNIPELIPLHCRFHNAFVGASKNLRLCQIICSLCDYVKTFENTFSYRPSKLQSGWEEHKHIVEAIDHKDDDRAEYVARNHLMHAKDVLLQALADRAQHSDQIAMT